MTRMIVGGLACWCAAAVWSVTQIGAAGQTAAVDYRQQVHPILAAKCLTCHSAQRRAGGLSFATYADVLQGGRSGARGAEAQRPLGQRAGGLEPVGTPLGDEQPGAQQLRVDIVVRRERGDEPLAQPTAPARLNALALDHCPHELAIEAVPIPAKYDKPLALEPVERGVDARRR